MLEGKVAVVTSGSSGIGKATAILMAEKGHKVVLTTRRQKGDNETVGIIRYAVSRLLPAGGIMSLQPPVSLGCGSGDQVRLVQPRSK